MTNLIAAMAVFVLIHLLVSGTRLRDALTGRIGEGPYMGLFSLASVGCLTWLILAFGHDPVQGSIYWTVTPATRDVRGRDKPSDHVPVVAELRV